MLAVALAAAAVVAAKPPPRQFLHADGTHHVASITLVAGYDSSNRGFNFDGYGRGELVVTVPFGWRVRVICTNRSDVRHSCAVVKGAMSAQPAFRGASVPNPLVGLRRGQTASFSFVAARPGPYRLVCLVPGHEEARMWDVLDVVRGGVPSIAARPGP
jgi:FtsP/CotA-like multicopper oxidase with cupredoxin domain